MQSRIGNKRKWVSLPLEDVSRDDADKTSGGCAAQSDTEPISDSSDPTAPNQMVHDNRAHYDSRSKWRGALFFFFRASVCFFSVQLVALYPLTLLCVYSPLFSNTGSFSKSMAESMKSVSFHLCMRLVFLMIKKVY